MCAPACWTEDIDTTMMQKDRLGRRSVLFLDPCTISTTSSFFRRRRSRRICLGRACIRRSEVEAESKGSLAGGVLGGTAPQRSRTAFPSPGSGVSLRTLPRHARRGGGRRADGRRVGITGRKMVARGVQAVPEHWRLYRNGRASLNRLSPIFQFFLIVHIPLCFAYLLSITYYRDLVT